MARKQGSHSDITGPRVLDTALRLIAEHGFAAVSMRQIASEVGVQAGALYNYTPDKQSLLFDMMRAHMAELLAALQSVDLQGDAVSQLETFTRFHIRFHLPRPDQVFVSYMELRSLSPENFSVIERMRRDYEDALEAILRQGEAEGVFAVADTRVATRAIIAMLTGLSHWYRDGGALDITAIEAIYWDMVRKSVAA
ncbi:TetR/AcrR family transcriptional regulator [Cognatiyoonia sp. IB215182]|uniref:TetR/AcrR family transcriptional regulator n=1 Tax=Cognatiyoonia sp. IB215182 TaxID=3097353 RepID=UPI002A13C00F|nr:TetR/AcrR family transcriptional regulator [Cognatiyoonia sp. IB215182]MDX8354392.1 TetR/AcrR family transcriptional regulator [Cognatiyoonia sp. IB215182]